MIVLRSTLFSMFFFASTFVLSMPAAIVSMIAPNRIMSWARFWARLQIGALRVICGIKVQVSGLENLPTAPVLIASRHESTFDILVWITLLPDACFVVKRQLGQIPWFGRCIRAAGMIIIDRQAGAAAMRALLKGADRAKAEGRHIVIFPEGTRVDPGEFPPMQPGVAAIASRTGLPLLPVMTDSGRCWGRRAFRKLPGTIHILIQPPLLVKSGREGILEALRAAFDPSKLVDKSVGELPFISVRD